jgi:hypothetical protein
MTLMIELTPGEEARLVAAAQEEGIEPTELARRFVRERLSPPVGNGREQDPMLALFRQWDEEDAAMTPEEVAEETRQWEELKANLNAERDREGARRVF